MREVNTERLSVWLTASAVILLGVAAGWAAVESTLRVAPSLLVVVSDVIAGASFAIVGAALWTRYRSKRVGGLAIAVGLALFLPYVRWFETSATWTLGWLLIDVHLVLLGWLVLAFPNGHLDRVERRYVVLISVYFALLAIAGHLFQNPVPGCEVCPSNFLLVRLDPGLNDLIWGVGQVINLLIVGLLIALIIRKRRATSLPGRRALSPVVWALWPIGLALILAFAEPLVGYGYAAAQAVLVFERLALVAFPLALGVGIVRTRFDQARVGDLAIALEEVLTSSELEDRIGEALGDPTARLVFWGEDGETVIDSEGRAVAGIGQTPKTTIRSAEGTNLAAILHDPAVDGSLVESVAAAATLSLRNERLRAELRRRLLEVESSRERIAEAALEERRRIERNLHDGAQQGLLALGANLSSIRGKVEGEVAELVDQTLEDLRATVDDLRDLARGLHPPILTDRGLAPAIETLAERSSIPVRVDVVSERFRPPIEAAAYFLAAEALTNTVRHANATSADVRAHRTDSWLVIEVTDDGEGGAESAGGTGLQGLADRVEALGGEMRVSSSVGGGTRVEARLPCE